MENNTITYSRPSGASNPFMSDPSGSQWGPENLEWLQVKLYYNLPADQLLLSLPKLPGFLDALSTAFGLSLQDIKCRDHEPNTFYARLRELLNGSPTCPDFEPSSPFTPSDTSTSRRPLRRVLSFSTPQNPIPHTPQVPARERPQRRRGRFPGSEYDSTPSKPPRSGLAHPTALVTQADPHSSSPCPKATGSSFESDSSYKPPSSPSPGTPPETVQPHNELDVEIVVQAFFQELVDIVKSILNLEVKVGTRPKYHVIVDGAMISATADLKLVMEYRQALHEVLVEVKKRPKQDSESEIYLPQEVSKMVAHASSLIKENKRSCRTILISWHQFEAYITRADVPLSYLNRLARDSESLKDTLEIHRSKPFNVLHSNELQEFAQAVVRSILTTVTRLNRGAALIRDLEEQPEPRLGGRARYL